ncbi:MAG: sporulation transcriptional regulator SpoIIID [Clostridiales bacterium]|nr:sporulation transcriptional regulator SpoIIID [Clostridiales bacterium]
MRDEIAQRVLNVSQFLVDTNGTVRSAAREFGISKSSVHTDVTKRLYCLNKELYGRVRKVLDINKEERHIRGGFATREKYKKERGEK